MSNFFGKNIKYLRKIKRISQQELADKLKINRSTISRYEADIMDPTIENVIEVSNVLGVTVADMVGKDIQNEDLCVDELEELFIQNIGLLTEDDRDTIRFIIEKRMKENERKN